MRNNILNKAIKLMLILPLVTILFASSPYNKVALPPDTKDTIFVYDTVEVYDIIYIYDTVFIEESVGEVVRKDTVWLTSELLAIEAKLLSVNSHLLTFPLTLIPLKQGANYFIEGYYGQNLTIPIFSGNSQLDQNLLLQREATKSGGGYNVGLGITRHAKSLNLSLGVSYSTITTKFELETELVTTDTSLFYKYFTRSRIEVDTIWFLNLENLLVTGDSTWFPYADTTVFTSLDSTKTTKIDTSYFHAEEKNINQYSYFEIPLIIGFPVKNHNFTLTPEVGIITGFIMNSQGKIVSLDNPNRSAVFNIRQDFVAVNFSYYAGIGVSYFISPKFDISAKAYFRQDIAPIFRNYPVDMHHRTFGAQFGIRYKLGS